MHPFRKSAAAIAAAIVFSVAPANAADPVTVASKIDTEGSLLGHMIVLVLEKSGLPVRNRIQLGPTNIVRTAILADEIDIYPEYTGNGAFFHNMADDAVWKNAKNGYEKIRQLDLEQNNLVWLTPAPANNTWAIAVRKDVAAEHDLTTMDDFARWAATGNVKLAGSAEFVESPAALPAFQTTYGFTLADEHLLVLAGGNTAATIRAAAEKTSGTNAAMVYGTDGAIDAAGLVVMEDTKGVQMVYEPAPVVRKETLNTYPNIAELLAPVFRQLDRETLQMLNGKIQVDGLPAEQVARGFLENKGLLTK